MIFRALQKRINELKPYHKGDNLITIETETDNFSKYIAIDLHKELQELYPSLEDDDLSEELVERYQDRIIDIMEKIFLLSEFNGRKVKKLEFSEEIEDFDAYYENNFANLVAAIEYFEEMWYYIDDNQYMLMRWLRMLKLHSGKEENSRNSMF